jgi:hypothetical protein
MGISGFRDGYLGTVSTKLGQRIDKIEWMNMYPKVNVYTHIQIYIYMEKTHGFPRERISFLVGFPHRIYVIYRRTNESREDHPSVPFFSLVFFSHFDGPWLAKCHGEYWV